jgi:hypothetical protein
MKYHYMLRKIPEEHRSDSHRGGSLKSLKQHYFAARQRHILRDCSILNAELREVFQAENPLQNHFSRFLSVERHTRLRVHKKSRAALIIVTDKHLPATMGLPRCAKLSVCKHSWNYAFSSYAASGARNFKGSLKN